MALAAPGCYRQMALSSPLVSRLFSTSQVVFQFRDERMHFDRFGLFNKRGTKKFKRDQKNNA